MSPMIGARSMSMHWIAPIRRRSGAALLMVSNAASWRPLDDNARRHRFRRGHNSAWRPLRCLACHRLEGHRRPQPAGSYPGARYADGYRDRLHRRRRCAYRLLALHRYRHCARPRRLPGNGRLCPFRALARKGGRSWACDAKEGRMMMDYALAIITAVLLLAGALFALVAAIGIVR